MNLSYLLYCKKPINGKLKCIYIKSSQTLSPQPKKYVKYNKKMVPYNKYEKLTAKKAIKKTKKVIKGGDDDNFVIFEDTIYPNDTIILQDDRKTKLSSNSPLYKGVQYSNFNITSVDQKRIDTLDANMITKYKIYYDNRIEYLYKNPEKLNYKPQSYKSSKTVTLQLLPKTHQKTPVRSSRTSRATRGLLHTYMLSHKKAINRPYYIVTPRSTTSIKQISPLSPLLPLSQSSSSSNRTRRLYRKTPAKPSQYHILSRWSSEQHSPRKRLHYGK
jgi:hypothetical protein